MRKPISVLLVLCLLSISGCTNDQQAIYDEFADKPSSAVSSAVSSTTPEEPIDELTGELTIRKKYQSFKPVGDVLTSIDLIAAEFEAMHPGVKITVEAGISAEEFNTTDENAYQAIESKYTQNLIVELMSGEAPDIIDMEGLSIPRYSKSGVLCNLYSFGDFDVTFPEDKYFTNILKAAETDKGLFAMPISARPMWYLVNQEVAGLL